MDGKIRGWEIKAEDVLPFTPGSAMECILMGMATTPDVGATRRKQYGAKLISGFIDFLVELAQKSVTITKFYATSATPTGIAILRNAGFMEISQIGHRIAFELDTMTSDELLATEYRKVSFLQACATCGFTPTGLACIAQVSPWIVYALLDRQPVPQKRARQVLQTMTALNNQGATYTLESVDVVIEETSQEMKQEGTECISLDGDLSWPFLPLLDFEGSCSGVSSNHFIVNAVAHSGAQGRCFIICWSSMAITSPNERPSSNV